MPTGPNESPNQQIEPAYARVTLTPKANTVMTTQQYPTPQASCYGHHPGKGRLGNGYQGTGCQLNYVGILLNKPTKNEEDERALHTGHDQWPFCLIHIHFALLFRDSQRPDSGLPM